MHSGQRLTCFCNPEKHFQKPNGPIALTHPLLLGVQVPLRPVKGIDL